MKSVYRVLSYLVAIEVVVQASAMVYAIAGLGKWVDAGGVLDKAMTTDDQTLPFAEGVGFMIHGINGMLIIPLIALLMLISSFFAKIPGGVKWAGVVLLLVVVQANLGMAGHDIPGLGALHGINALLLFTAALHTARRSRAVPAGASVDAPSTKTANA